MQHLHSSPVHVHGNLKSSNVVIDSRWTCKVTDHNLVLFKEGEKKDRASSYYGMFNTNLKVADRSSFRFSLPSTCLVFFFRMQESTQNDATPAFLIHFLHKVDPFNQSRFSRYCLFHGVQLSPSTHSWYTGLSPAFPNCIRYSFNNPMCGLWNSLWSSQSRGRLRFRVSDVCFIVKPFFIVLQICCGPPLSTSRTPQTLAPRPEICTATASSWPRSWPWNSCTMESTITRVRKMYLYYTPTTSIFSSISSLYHYIYLHLPTRTHS